MSRKPIIAILNSSSFGKHHPDHVQRLEAIATLRRVTVAADATAQDLLPALEGVSGIIASVTPRIGSDVICALPELVLIARHGIGCDNVDLQAATNSGVYVSRVDGPIERNAVAEMAVALMLAAGRFIEPGHKAVASGRWHDRANFIGMELSGKTIGVIGIGNIGSRVAEILGKGFGAKILASDPLLTEGEISARGAESVGLERLLSESDIVSFHCPLLPETQRMLNTERLALMKPKALLINTCRGELLDESALLFRLKSGELAAYATDVVEGEPIGADHRLLQAPNVVVLPHLGGYTVESLRGMGDTMVQDCEAVFTRGEIPGVLANPEVVPRGARRWA